MTQEGAENFEAELERLAVAPDAERDQILATLAEAARTVDGTDGWERYGLALSAAGHGNEAISIFRNLTDNAPAGEQRDKLRYNLAFVYLQSGQLRLALHHFGQVAKSGATPEVREWASRGVQQVDDLTANGERDRRLFELQVAWTRERLATTSGSEEDYLALGRLLLQLDAVDTNSSHLEEGIRALEEGSQRYPVSVPIRELLLAGYSRGGSTAQWEKALVDLERLAPDSPILSTVQQSGIERPTHVENQLERARALIEQAGSEDPELSLAAVDELGRLVRTFPQNPDYRSLYAFGLLASGRKSEAMKEGEILEAAGTDTHEHHLNLGQIFWAAGDQEKGKRHLRLAAEYARTDEDLSDVETALTYLGAK